MAIENMDQVVQNDVPSRRDILARDDAMRALLDLESITPETISIVSATSAIASYITKYKEDWETQAECKGLTRYFYAQTHESKDDRIKRTAIALAICNSCNVLENCKERAVTNKEKFGIWGGVDFEEKGRVGRPPIQ